MKRGMGRPDDLRVIDERDGWLQASWRGWQISIEQMSDERWYLMAWHADGRWASNEPWRGETIDDALAEVLRSIDGE